MTVRRDGELKAFYNNVARFSNLDECEDLLKQCSWMTYNEIIKSCEHQLQAHNAEHSMSPAY